MRYRVREPLLTVRQGPEGKFLFTTLPSGALIVTENVPNRSGFVAIEYGGERFLVFPQDIEDRCIRMTSEAHGQS